MTIIKTRIGGTLVETDDTNIAQQAAAVGQPTPITPVGAAGVGANPDASKMAGTPNQTAPVIEQAVAPAETLQTAQRTQGPRQTASVPEEQAAEKAAKLATLGSLGTRVEAMISQQLKLQTPVVAGVDETAVNALAPALQDQARTLMAAVVANPADMAAQATAAQFFKDNGMTFDPKSFVAQGADALGKQAADQVADVATLETLPLEQNEQDALTAVMGDGWKSLTVPQLQQKIEEMRQSEFSRTQSIRAELSGATGARREQLLQQLNEAGQTGVSGIESSVEDLTKAISNADVVTIAGEQHKVEDLLKDEEISELVTRMLRDPKLAGEVAKSNPEFAKWVSDNAKALGEVAKDVDVGRDSLDSLQEQKKGLATVAEGVTLSDTVMAAIMPDWDKVSDGNDTITSGLYDVLKDPALDENTRSDMVAALERAQNDPKTLRDLAKLSAEEFKASYEMAEALENDPLLAKLAGLGADEGFVMDPAKQQEIMKLKITTDALEAAKAGASTGYLAALEAPELQALIKSGDFTPEHAKLLAKHPERLPQYTANVQTHKDLAEALAGNDADKALDIMFGRDVDLEQLNDEYARSKRIISLDPNDKGAKKRLETFLGLDSNRDGKIDGKDTNNIVERAQKDASVDGKNDGKPGSLTDILGGGVTLERPKEFERNELNMPIKNSALIDTMEAIMEGGVSYSELAGQPQKVIDAFMTNTMLNKKYKIDPTGMRKFREAEEVKAISKSLNGHLTSLGLGKPKLDTASWQAWVANLERTGGGANLKNVREWLENMQDTATTYAGKKFYETKVRELYESRKATRDAINAETAAIIASRDYVDESNPLAYVGNNA